MFNAGGAGQFNGDNFLFVSEDGTVSGWRGSLGTTAEPLASVNGIYKGAAFATVGGNSYLYAADFGRGSIDVFKGNVGATNLTGSFTDASLPSGFVPFNVQMLDNSLFVTYALQRDGRTPPTRPTAPASATSIATTCKATCSAAWRAAACWTRPGAWPSRRVRSARWRARCW